MSNEYEEEGARGFAHFILDLANGQAHLELSEELYRLTSQLQEQAHRTEREAKGELMLKLSFAVQSSDVVAIGYSIKPKVPEPKRPVGMHWLTPGGNLTPQNPRQQNLPLREVGGEEDGPREVRGASGTTPREV